MNCGAKQIFNNVYHKEDKIEQFSGYKMITGANCTCILCFIARTNIHLLIQYHTLCLVEKPRYHKVWLHTGLDAMCGSGQNVFLLIVYTMF